MRIQFMVLRVVLALMCFMLANAGSMAQSIKQATATPPKTPQDNKWKIDIRFVPKPLDAKIKRVFFLNVDDAEIIPLTKDPNNRVYSATLDKKLELVTPQDGCLEFKKHYEVKAIVENDKGDKILSLGAELVPLDEHCQKNSVQRDKAKGTDDADINISGEVNGAKDRDASFTTAIKLQRYRQAGSWRFTPFFKLNASTDPDADPDSMEMGLRFRKVLDKFGPGAYFDNDVKLESERDFDNTNLIYATRLTLLPPPLPKNPLSKGKTFFTPYLGAEAGRNLKTPLKAAEGDGIARLLAGADLRFAFFLKDDTEPDIDWTTSFTRRWLLTDELGFEADKDGVLQLVRFGTSPRDYLLSKVSYKVTNFLDVFGAYEWGQLPPSYKFVDNRFQFGFAYKFKFAVK